MSKAVDLSSVKKSVLSSVWLVCSECLKERTMIDAEPGASHDIVVCLKCGFQVISTLKKRNIKMRNLASVRVGMCVSLYTRAVDLNVFTIYLSDRAVTSQASSTL